MSSSSLREQLLRQVLATRIISRIMKYINPKYANIPEYVEFCQHVLNVCPQAKDELVEFMRINSPPASTKTLVRIVQNMAVNDTGVYELDQYDLKIFVPTENFSDYENVFRKYSKMSEVKLDESKSLGMLREKVLSATTLKEVVSILDDEAPSTCRLTKNVVKTATKIYPTRMADEILGNITVDGIKYGILEILMKLPELKIEIIIPPRVKSFLCIMRQGSFNGLKKGECVPIETIFHSYKNWITDVGINPISDDDIQYFWEYTTFENIYIG